MYIDSSVFEPGDILLTADTEGRVAAFQVTPEGDITELDLSDAIHQRYIKAREVRLNRRRELGDVVDAFESGEIRVLEGDD